MALKIKNLLFHFLIVFSLLSLSIAADEDECIYGIFVQTGSIPKAGTHSTIGLTLRSSGGTELKIPNLEDWGLMGSGYNYFEKGNLDLFGGKAPCLLGPICSLNLTSDGSGPYSAWYCEYVQVGVVGLTKDCLPTKFDVNQWLAKDEQLSYYKDVCLRGDSGYSIVSTD